jgi:hypothetical protein
MEGSRERTVATEKHVRPPQVHMNVNTCPTPPQPTRAYIHLPAATEKHFLSPQVHMNVNTCPTPPQPNPSVALRATYKER